ncbi:hypothetical protein NC653_002403 [Populus alba x Populus x berolinensis]|uniref:Lamin-like protein n=2 Tax=Populus TaxID=3689 RepID=A0A4U5LST9_POPAL|nr:hypothetical protein NC653_002403 [Populus alba x Populus x berolinensis]TKR59089.1 hypothetical protein D5086_0000326500 [Populus alba]
MNFTASAMHEEFYAGDWLYFVFDKTRYSVLERQDHIYFLSGRGYCFKGMKVVVHAQYPPPDPAPLAVGNVCPSKSASHGLAVLLALFTSYAVMG